MNKVKKTTLGFESLESKRTLSSVSVVSEPIPHRPQVAVQAQQSRPVLNPPRFIGTYQGAGSLAGISVSANDRTLPILAISTGRGGTITSTINDPGVIVRTMRNSAGGTTLYIGGPAAAVNRNMKFLTYRGNESGIRVELFVCNATSCTRYADVRIPIRRF
jgi:hypothetical protein